LNRGPTPGQNAFGPFRLSHKNSWLSRVVKGIDWSGSSQRSGLVKADTHDFRDHVRVRIFVPILFPLFGIEGDNQGRGGTDTARNRWGFKADRVFIKGIAGLSRRRQGFETPWDCQLPEPVSGLSPHILPVDFSPAFFATPSRSRLHRGARRAFTNHGINCKFEFLEGFIRILESNVGYSKLKTGRFCHCKRSVAISISANGDCFVAPLLAMTWLETLSRE
jgi:hypothetical protein